MIKKTIILLVLYFFLLFLTSLRGKEYFAKLTNSQEPESEPGVFGSLESEPLEKKSGAGAGNKFAGSPALPQYHLGGFTARIPDPDSGSRHVFELCHY